MNEHTEPREPQELDDLTDRLHRLAAGVQPPPADPTADLRRGRTRLVWRRAAAGGAALLTVGVIGGVALVGNGLTGADHDSGNAGYAGGSGSAAPTAPTQAPTPTSTPTPTPTPSSTRAPTAAATSGPDLIGGFNPQDTSTLKTYNNVLAEHLDPQRQHLQPFSEKTRNEQSSSSISEGMTSYGSKFGWQVDGSDGLGMLEIVVSTHWRGGDSFAEESEAWQDATVAGATRAQVATSDGVIEVRVQRADGLTVQLISDPLFGNNSLIAVPDMGLTAQQLLQAAADPRLTLPPAGS